MIETQTLQNFDVARKKANLFKLVLRFYIISQKANQERSQSFCDQLFHLQFITRWLFPL